MFKHRSVCLYDNLLKQMRVITSTKDPGTFVKRIKIRFVLLYLILLMLLLLTLAPLLLLALLE
jgi:hypothetical protein